MNFANLGAALKSVATAAAEQFVRFDIDSMTLSLSPQVTVALARKRGLDIKVARDNVALEHRIAFGFTVDARISTFIGTRIANGLSVVSHPVAGTIRLRHRYKAVELGANALLAVSGWKRRLARVGFAFAVTEADVGWAALIALLPRRAHPCVHGEVRDSWLELRLVDVDRGDVIRAAPDAATKLVAYALSAR